MAVDIQALATSYEQEVRRLRTEVLMQLRDVLADELRVRPEARDALLTELQEYRTRFKKEGRKDMEDLVLNAMDMLAGWSARAVRI